MEVPITKNSSNQLIGYCVIRTSIKKELSYLPPIIVSPDAYLVQCEGSKMEYFCKNR